MCSLENPEGCSRSDAPPGEQEDTKRIVYFTQTVHNKIISGLFRGSDKPYVVQLRNKNEPAYYSMAANLSAGESLMEIEDDDDHLKSIFSTKKKEPLPT